ncbi:MAG: hypothetical protein CL912_25780 [Deltaproteobacteria bacterium]|nr:hypothetical protein [Deltaproteobacteria bacterium]MAD86383.1 hypothetical protein [Deltaproteobacteria bacterium]
MTAFKTLKLPVLVSVLYISNRIVIWLDLLYRIILAERNRIANSKKLSTEPRLNYSEKATPSSIACLVGYREEERLFQDALISYNSAGTKTLVVGIDGNSAEDEEMVKIFQRVRQP